MFKTLKYFALSMISVALASCSSNDEPDSNVSLNEYISFAQPTVNLKATLSDFADNAGTRAMSTTIDEFRVWGFCKPNDLNGNLNDEAVDQEWEDKSIFFTKGADVFNGMKVINKATDGFGSYDQNNADYKQESFKKWADVSTNEDAVYTFIAGYDPTKKGVFSMSAGSASTGASHGPRLSFTIGQEGNDVNNSKLIYEDQPDALVAVKYKHQKSDGRVGLSFFHFMTGIRFNFNNYTPEKDKKNLIIKKVIFKGKFHKTAIFDFTTTTPVMSVKDSYSGYFTLFEGEQTILPESSDYMRKTPNDEPVTLLLLPDPTGTTADDEHYTLGSDKVIQIEYSIGGKDGLFEYKNFTLNYLPKSNTLHTANFNFVDDEFIVMFQADDKTNWENGSDNNVIIK